MSQSTDPVPPPLPPTSSQPLDYAGASTEKAKTGLDVYNDTAESIGFMPTLRLSTNIIQLLAGVAGGVVGVGAAMIYGGPLIAWIIGGVLAGIILSGAVFAILRPIQQLQARRRRKANGG